MAGIEQRAHDSRGHVPLFDRRRLRQTLTTGGRSSGTRVPKAIRMLTICVIVMLIGLGIPAAASAQSAPSPNLLTNGSFEGTSLSPWSPGGSGVDQVTGWNAENGTKLVDLNAQAPGSVSQSFSTVPGGQYSVSFWLSGNPQCGTNVTKEVTASAGDASHTYSYTVPSGATESNLQWVNETFDFNVTGTSATLTFASFNTSGACGALIDNVVVNLVSAPPSLSVSGSALYVENSAPVVVDPGLTVGGTENIDGAKASIGANFNPAQDRLGIEGQTSTSGTVLGLSWSYNSTTGVLAISGTADPATYQAALRKVTFSNNSENPSASPRTVTFNLGSQLAFSVDGQPHYYKFVPANDITWTDAEAAAASDSLYGLQGYLATITSAAENSFIKNKLQGNGWLGANDLANTGDYEWVTGPEAGTVFCDWAGSGNCVPQGGAYTNWDSGEPNNFGGEHYVHMLGNPGFGAARIGKWNNLPNSYPANSLYTPLGYVVEYGGMPGDPALQLSGNVSVDVQPVNDPPTANAGGPYTVNEGSSITLTGSGSDVDSTSLTYAWDLDNNGTFETPGQNVIFNGVDGPSTQTVKLQVCDTGTPLPSACTVASTTVTVNNVAPSVSANVTASNTAYYVHWTAANPSAGTASGYIQLPNGHQVGVTFSAVNSDNSPASYWGAQTDGAGTFFWSPASTFTSTDVPNSPTWSDILQLSGGNNTTYRVTFSEPIANPIMDILSLGQAGNAITYNFDSPFTILSQGPSTAWGGCNTCLTQLPGDVLQGREGDGTIKFVGTYTTFSWQVPTNEVWHGFTFGIQSTTALGNLTVNEGDTATNSGTWSDPGVNDNVQLSASIGNVVKNANGTWSWSFATTDGPSQSQTVTITATDKDGASNSVSFPLTVKNVAPSVSQLNDGTTFFQGDSITLHVSATDPGVLDTHSMSVDWGDSNVANSAMTDTTGSNLATGTASHEYDVPGTYTVTITVTDNDGGVGTTTLTVTVLPVKIDIKPGSDVNPVNLNGNGLLPVAILGSNVLDVTKIDASTITFGLNGDEATPYHNGGHYEDVNNDGYMDLVVHFVEGDLGLGTPDVYADKSKVELTMNGAFQDGRVFKAQDYVTINPNNANSQGKGGHGPKKK